MTVDCIGPNGQIPDGNVDITVEDRLRNDHYQQSEL